MRRPLVVLAVSVVVALLAQQASAANARQGIFGRNSCNIFLKFHPLDLVAKVVFTHVQTPTGRQVVVARLYTRKSAERTFHFVTRLVLGPWGASSKFQKVSSSGGASNRGRATISWSGRMSHSVTVNVTPTALTRA